MFSVVLFTTLLLHLYYYYAAILPEISFKKDTHLRSYVVVKSKTGENDSIVMVENDTLENIEQRRLRYTETANATRVLTPFSPAAKVIIENNMIEEAIEQSNIASWAWGSHEKHI